MSQPPYPSARAPFTLTLGDALLGGGGALIFLFSFAPFISGGRLKYSAWATQFFMAPLTWWAIFAGMIMVALALTRNVWPPQREFYGFKPSHVEVGVSLFAFLVLIGYALSDKTEFFDFGWGGVIMTLGSVVAVVGALMNHLGIGPTLLPNARQAAYPAPPASYPEPPAGPPA
jgi:hypothetical protein